MRVLRLALSVGIALLLGSREVNAATSADASGSRLSAMHRFVLMGASIGRGWDLPEFPARMGLPDLEFEYVGVFDFDKSLALAKILPRETERPDAIILKECATYFPGDLARYQRLVLGWIADCRRVGVVPILATVSPVSAPRGAGERLRALVRTQVLGRPDQNREVWAYNDWVRQLAANEGLPLLDLEAAVRVSESDRSLRADLGSGDGLHLGARGYAAFDRALATLVTGSR